MDSLECQGVVESTLLHFLRGRRHRTHVLQQGTAAVHVSSSSKGWLHRHKIQVTDWPACFPESNPMENMWVIVVRRVYETVGKTTVTHGDSNPVTNGGFFYINQTGEHPKVPEAEKKLEEVTSSPPDATKKSKLITAGTEFR
ncbi:unnamed protein product [Heligmosomoides polygyrus]|uniref:DDE_3 domain-containing protein n=1 Tax=Heligmosomoides polygyrus TaxID=6339 RepID=A0A183G9I8_HELPZ|nr:unnamed protein product [Heligmosomoides polygyrus]